MSRVVVATVDTSRRPEFGGWFWVPLQYVLGLREIGIETWWIDHLRSLKPYRKDHTAEYLWETFSELANHFGLDGRWGIIHGEESPRFGLSDEEIQAVVDEADLLIALGRSLPEDSPLLRIPRKAYVDVDPGFTQIWAQQRPFGLGRYDHFFTVGQNVGSPEFGVSTRGISWQPILPPVHLASWPACIDERCRRFSTVADWRGDQIALFQDELYGTKRSEFIRYLHVPMNSGQKIELALCIGQHDHEDLGLLLGHNWRVRNPYQYAGDPLSYREFIQYSRAEFGVAKNGYVKSNSGWFSDRTACYLASGKPALVQSTGFEHRMPTGKGLLTFGDVEEAVAGIHEINENYVEHCEAARRFAEEHLDSRKTLPRMLQAMGL